MTRNRVGLVIIGVVVASLLANVLNLAALSVAYLMSPATLEAFRGSTLHSGLSMLAALLGLAAGAFVAVRVGKVDVHKTPLDIGVAHVAITLIFAAFRSATVSWPWVVGGAALFIPASLLGGWLARRRA